VNVTIQIAVYSDNRKYSIGPGHSCHLFSSENTAGARDIRRRRYMSFQQDIWEMGEHLDSRNSFTIAHEAERMATKTAAEVQAATLDKFIQGWAGWTPEGFLATWADGCTQQNLPFSSKSEVKTHAHVEHLFPVLMSILTNFEVSPSFSRTSGYTLTQCSLLSTMSSTTWLGGRQSSMPSARPTRHGDHTGMSTLFFCGLMRAARRCGKSRSCSIPL
jgi:hypothetical protein